MSADLSYPPLRAVLEYLEANKRIHIAARSPALRQFDKSIPIHFDYLVIFNDGFYANQIASEMKILDLYWDTTNSTRKQPLIEILFRNLNSGFRLIRRHPIDLKSASRTLSKLFLGYSKTYAIFLEFFALGFSMLRPPVKTKFLPKIFDINNNNFEDCMQLLDSSVQLGTLRITVTDEQILFLPKIRTIDTLIIQDAEEYVPLLTVAKMSNKHVEMSNMMPEKRDIITFLQKWQRGIGSSFTLRTSGEEFIRNILEEIKKRCKGEYRMLEKRGQEIPYCVTFQRSATSELNIYGIKVDYSFMLKIEENPIGTSRPFSTGPEPSTPRGSMLPMFIQGLRKNPKSEEASKCCIS